MGFDSIGLIVLLFMCAEAAWQLAPRFSLTSTSVKGLSLFWMAHCWPASSDKSAHRSVRMRAPFSFTVTSTVP